MKYKLFFFNGFLMQHRVTLPLVVLTFTGLAIGCSNPPQKKTDDGPLVDTTKTVKTPTAEELTKVGNTALTNRKYKDAILAYEKAIALSPKRWEIHHNLAIAYSHKPDFHKSIDAIRKAMSLGADKDHRVWFTLGNLYQNRGMYEESIQAYRAGLSLHTAPHVDSLLNISAGYLFLFRYDEAKKTLDYLQELAPNDPRVHHNVALIYHLQRKYKEAAVHYNHVHKIAPKYDYSYFSHGDLLRVQGKCKDAIPMFKKYLELSPKGPYIVKAKSRLKSCQEQVK